jgi:anti-sigma factor RsiW
MNACPKWKEELIDYALGRPAGASLEAHLAACTGCSQALQAWRQKAAQMDAGVQQLTAAEPAAYGPQRILTQIQQLSPSKSFYGRVALAALILTISLVVLLYRPARPKKVPFPVVALSTWRSPTEWLLHSSADPLLRSVPHLGERFFETKPAGDKNAQ